MMKNGISVLIITKNAADVINKSLRSVAGWADEIIIVDDYSTDDTVKIAGKFKAKIYFHHEIDLGKQKQYALSKATKEWVLVLDSDEVVPKELKKEIRDSSINPRNNKIQGCYIYFRNHFLGRPIYFGGENYKMPRLFKRQYVRIKPALVHEKFELIKGKMGILKNPIFHYSYRSLGQMYGKFTGYAIREYQQKKTSGEKSSLKKIFLYPVHMFWARFVNDKGYKDGIFRIPLDLGFAYMEFLTYFLLFFQPSGKSRVISK